LLRSERDELGPSAPTAFNQREETLELNVAVKDVEFKMYSKHLLAECKDRMRAKRAANLAGL